MVDLIQKMLGTIEDVENNPSSENEIISDASTESPEMQNGPKNIEQMRSEMEAARKDYLKVDYEKNTAISRLRNYFGHKNSYDIERDGEVAGKTDYDIAWYRAQYDNKLFDLQEKMVADAQERGASDQELAKLYIEFRTEQKINLAAEHDNVKAEQRFGTKMGKIGEMAADAVKWYQALPIQTKLAVSAIFMVSGALSTGTAMAGIVAGGVAARRIFGGMSTGLGLKWHLEARGQKKDKERIDLEEDKFLNELENLSEDEKFELLSRNIKEIAIKDKENTINKIKNQDIKQLTAAAGVGVFIGSGLFADMIRGGYHKVAGFFGGENAEIKGLEPKKDGYSHKDIKFDSNNANPTDSAKSVIFEKGNVYPKDSVAGKVFDSKNIYHGDSIKTGVFDKSNLYPADSVTPLNNSFMHPSGAHANIDMHLSANTPAMPADTAEALRTPAASLSVNETLKIEKGSSIEKTLIDHIKKIHPEMKNPGNIAHRMWLDYMHDNKEGIIKKVGIEEYQKMLKDGMVNVKPGTALVLDEKDPFKLKLQDISGRISHLDGSHNSSGGHVSGHASATKIETPSPAGAAVSGMAQSKVISSENLHGAIVDHVNSENDYAKIEAEMGVENEIRKASENYGVAASDAVMHPAGPDGPSSDQYSRMGIFDSEKKSLTQTLNTMKAQDLQWANTNEVGALIEKGAGTKQILGTYLNKITGESPDKLAFWQEIKNKPFGEVDFGKNSENVTKTIAEFKKAVGEKYADQINPKTNLMGVKTEKTGEWLARITKLALRVNNK